jgi:3-deoxy-7-phosphoheptulonate synthase
MNGVVSVIILMQPEATVRQAGSVIQLCESASLRPYLSLVQGRRVIAVISEDAQFAEAARCLPGVGAVQPLSAGAKLSTRAFRSENSILHLSGNNGNPAVMIGGGSCTIIAGPCAVEDRETLLECAHRVRQAGGHLLRGGAFKPRTSPYSFQGLGLKGLELLAEARDATHLPIVTEVLSVDDLPAVARYADILQIGARNMQNFALLRAAGETGRPVLLKRGMMSTLEELLLSAEYILATGNESVILCERGIRTFEPSTRNTLDIAAVPVLRRESHLPIIVDPSHAAGHRDLVVPLALAAVAAGADGLIVEVHPHPDRAMTDADQTITLDTFEKMMAQIGRVRDAIRVT